VKNKNQVKKNKELPQKGCQSRFSARLPRGTSEKGAVFIRGKVDQVGGEKGHR